jgi:hypothetical protein
MNNLLKTPPLFQNSDGIRFCNDRSVLSRKGTAIPLLDGTGAMTTSPCDHRSKALSRREQKEQGSTEISQRKPTKKRKRKEGEQGSKEEGRRRTSGDQSIFMICLGLHFLLILPGK